MYLNCVSLVCMQKLVKVLDYAIIFYDDESYFFLLNKSLNRRIGLFKLSKSCNRLQKWGK